jgi:uncharacterized protein (DUF433 family)
MSEPQQIVWKHLAPRPGSLYRQLFIKGTRIRARDLHGRYMNSEQSMTPEEIACEYGLPLEAVEEAIAYCRSVRRRSARTGRPKNRWKRRWV